MWLHHRLAVFLPLAAALLQGCSESQPSSGAATSGGARGGGSSAIVQDTGGASVTQATTILAGASALGGTASTGAAPGLGGAGTSGGRNNSGGTESKDSAPASAGGAGPLGGMQNSGGASATGAANSAGGSSTTGGSKASGGTTSTNGTKGSGGMNMTGGTKASGGTGAIAGATSTSRQNMCGTASEDASVTLTCPQGQIVDSVVFASYGTPTGTCGSFAAGSCDATSSKTMVESLCLGRSSCTVPATNGAFGDPCRSTTKQLSVEVSCIEGTPTVTPDSPYKGVANSPASQIAALGATWCYNWGTAPKSSDCADPYFVPMIWDGSNVAGAIKSIGAAGYTTVLGFNEPNKSDQANMSVADAIALWPTMTSDANIRVGSPAVSDDGRSWLVDFMTQAKAKGLRVDFIAMHWYGWNTGSCVASQLEGAVNWASQWGLPVWITEFGCMGSSNTDAQTVLKFFNDAIKMLNNHPLVERYSWYPWNTYNELYQSNTMTDLGKAFAAAPQYR